MPSVDQVAGKIRNTLRLTDPDLDTTIGTPVRKIIDAVAEAIAEASTDAYLVGYQYDIDTKSGAELDDFVKLFGFSRLPARRATGLVTFERTTPASQPITLPPNTQLITDSLPQVIIATVTPGVFSIGATTVTVPGQAVVSGSAGNISAHSVGRALTTLQGVSSFSNPQAFTGGVDAETDAALRARFKRTIFRSMAGTECQPPGTMVLVPASDQRPIDMKYVPIETLQPGDRVAAWRQGYMLKEGREVLGVGSRFYSGALIRVEAADGRMSRYTPNHRCIARFGPALVGKHIVYLQRLGDSFRIGTTTDRRANRNGEVVNASGIVSRLREQGADDAWILSIHDSKEEALLSEQYTSWLFGIPETLFRANRGRGDGNQPRLDAFWSKVGDLTARAVECLSHHGRMLEYPLITRSTRRFIWNRAGEVRACNLISGCEVIDVDSMRLTGEQFPHVEYATVTVQPEFYEGDVWSLDVAKEQTYIADGFVTHNSMYLATALEHPNVVQANVVSAVKRQREQIQITSGTGTSSLASAKFIYPDTSALGPNINSGDILTPDIHYSFSAITNPPTVTSLSGSVMPDGIYDLEFDYLSAASRNDPDGFITNRVDIWVRGQRPTEAIETMVFSSGRIFNSISGSELNHNNFQRENETLPEANNFFIPFGFSPVIDPSPNGDVMVINGVTYIRNTHYWLVQDITSKGMSNRGFSGVEFKSLTNGLALAEPANGQHWSQTYIFDAAPRDIDVSVQRWRMVTNDLWVHAARRIKLKAYFAVILTPGYNLAAVTDAVYTALSAFTQEVSFDQVLQASDVLAVAHAVPGVDAVRFLTSTDNPTNYAWQRLDPADTVLHTYATGGRAIDIFCDDDTVVDLSDVVLVAKAQNTWSTV